MHTRRLLLVFMFSCILECRLLVYLLSGTIDGHIRRLQKGNIDAIGIMHILRRS